MADAVFYLPRSGCAWRMLPQEYPPWQTVYFHFDSQAVKGTGVGGTGRGYDGAKRPSGRKRHLLVDTGGLVLGARVHAESLHGRDGAYTRGFREWAGEEREWRVEVPHHRGRQL